MIVTEDPTGPASSSDKSSRSLLPLPSGPYIPVSEIPNEIKRLFDKATRPFFGDARPHPPPPLLRPEEARTLTVLAQAALVVFVCVVAVLLVVLCVVCVAVLADCCRETNRSRRERRRRERYASALKMSPPPSPLPPVTGPSAPPPAGEKPQQVTFLQVVEEDHVRLSATPSVSTVSTAGRSGEDDPSSSWPPPPPSSPFPPRILVTGDSDGGYEVASPPSRRDFSLSRSLGGIYEEMGPPSANYLTPKEAELKRAR